MCLRKDHSREQVETDFRKLMSLFDNNSYGILMVGATMFYGCVGYVNEPLALPLDVVFQMGTPMVWCMHDFVDELKSCRRRYHNTLYHIDRDILDIMVYKNPRTKMSNKSCNNFCLKNVVGEEQERSLLNDEIQQYCKDDQMED